MKHFLQEIVNNGVLSERERREVEQDRKSGKQKIRENLVKFIHSSKREQQFLTFIRGYASHVHTMSLKALASLETNLSDQSRDSHHTNRSEQWASPPQLSQDSLSHSESGSTSPELDHMTVSNIYYYAIKIKHVIS